MRSHHFTFIPEERRYIFSTFYQHFYLFKEKYFYLLEREASHLLVHSPDAHSSLSWARIESEERKESRPHAWVLGIQKLEPSSAASLVAH